MPPGVTVGQDTHSMRLQGQLGCFGDQYVIVNRHDMPSGEMGSSVIDGCFLFNQTGGFRGEMLCKGQAEFKDASLPRSGAALDIGAQ